MHLRSAEIVDEPFQIALDDRGEHCIDDGRRAAFVLAVLRIDIGGPRNAHARERDFDRLGEAPLVSVVDVCVQQTDRNGRDAALSQFCAHLRDRCFIQRNQNVPPVIDALANRQPVAARD